MEFVYDDWKIFIFTDKKIWIFVQYKTVEEKVHSDGDIGLDENCLRGRTKSECSTSYKSCLRYSNIRERLVWRTTFSAKSLKQ